MSYRRGAVPSDPKDIPAFLNGELQELQQQLNAARDLLELVAKHVAPARLYDGMVAYADGTDWDPGSGEGLYAYYGAQWNSLGGGGGTPAGADQEIQYNESGAFAASSDFKLNTDYAITTLYLHGQMSLEASADGTYMLGGSHTWNDGARNYYVFDVLIDDIAYAAGSKIFRFATNTLDFSLDANFNLTTPGYVRTQAKTVATLPAAGTAGSGARSFVTDATATTFLSTVAGGGANKVPVVSDGTNWLIG